MAADTRPYKSKEQDGQGNEVIIRDQQLVEQSTVTTMPSGACFETFDIDGRPVKIPRDNMISIVLECMGIVLNDSSKNLGTNVNKALGLQGNTIGNVTVSDLASVLGVKKWTNAYMPHGTGAEAIITTSRTDSILFVRSGVDGNGYGIITQGTKEGLDYYNLSRSGTTITLTPNTAISGQIQYIEW